MTGDRIITHVHRTTDLTPGDWDDIWTLTDEFYDVERAYAEAELRKRERIALFRMNGALLGMASITIYAEDFRGRRVIVINTSHVLIRENWRGRNLIQKLGFRTFLGARLRHPLRPIYWFFDTFSYKSYLLLPRNFRDFWPRFDRRTPEWEAGLMDHLAARTYGAAWQPAAGIVARSGQKRLRPETAPLRPALAGAPDIEFFARTNPEHAEGDMLVCLCPLTAANWLRVGLRALKRSLRSSGAKRRPA
jgi:hypothetical protein